MRILLINICLRYDSPIKQIPVGLSCIATALKCAGYQADILDIDLYRYSDDGVIDFLGKNSTYDVVGMGSISSGYKHIKRIAKLVKEAMPQTLLVVGNTVATSMPSNLLKYVPEIDIAVIGEGDETIVDIVKLKANKKDYKEATGIAYRDNGKVIFTQKQKAISNIEDIPFPDYSLFEVEKYLSVSRFTLSEPFPLGISFEDIRALPLNTARGCPFNCTFCAHAFKGYKYRYYSFDKVVNHIKYLQERYGINHIHFWDELTIFSPARLKELCDSIEKVKVRFYWGITSRANTFTMKDLDLLKRSRDLGALTLGGAIESSDPQILKAMNKEISIERCIEQVEVARKAEFEVSTSLVFGYPQETEQSIKKTIELCRRLKIYPSTGFLLPLPGAEIYEYARNKGYITDEEEYLLRIGDRQDLHINLTQMPDELFLNTLKGELIKLKNDLGISLPDEKVIKTGVYRIAKRKEESVS